MLHSACPSGPKMALHFPHPLVCFFLCAHTYHMYNNNIMLRELLPCNFIVNLMAALSTGVATASNLAH